MKKLMCSIIVLCLIVSTLPIAGIASENDIELCSVKVSYEDNPGQIESIAVATNGTNVWVNAKDLYGRLGYSVEYSKQENTIIIYNAENAAVPVLVNVFHCESTTVYYAYLNSGNLTTSEYSAPFQSFVDKNGWWVPFEYSLYLNRSGMRIQGNTVKIASPRKNLADVFYELAGKYNEFVFDWCDDFGYETDDEFLWLNQYEWVYSANYLTLLLDGILSLEGGAYVTFISQLFGESTGFDVKYGATLTRLLCTDSDEEYTETVEHAQMMSDLFFSDGQLGELLTEIRGDQTFEISQLSSRCDALKKQISEDNPVTVLQYNREYQRLEDVMAQQDVFEATGGNILEIQNQLSDALPVADCALKALEVLGYAQDFSKQDGYAVSAMERYLNGLPGNHEMHTMNLAMENELNMLKSNGVEYSLYRYFVSNWKEIVGADDVIANTLGTKANVMLFAWSLASNFLPYISDGLDSADQFMVGTYASVVQHDAFNQYAESKHSISTEASNEDFVKSAQLCYIYLKSCYVARESALASLCNAVDDVDTSTEPLIVENRKINSEIAEYLAWLKNIPSNNQAYAFGFLSADNEEYLKNYDDSKILAILKQSAPDADKNYEGENISSEVTIGGLTYIMRKEVIEFPLSDGTVYYRNAVEYPLFLGNTAVEKEVNNRYSEIIMSFRGNKTDYDQLANDYYDGDLSRLTLPFYDDIETEITYCNKGVLSIREYRIHWMDGAHVYTSTEGLCYDISTAQVLQISDIIVGTEEEREQLLTRLITEKIGGMFYFSMSGYFTEEGLCLLINVGEAALPAEILIPFTDTNSYKISAKVALGITDNGQSGDRQSEYSAYVDLLQNIRTNDENNECMMVDIDNNGIEELIVMYTTDIDNGYGKFPHMVCEMYTINDAEVVTLIDTLPMYAQAGGPSGSVSVARIDGVNYLAITSEGGETGGYPTNHRSGEWYLFKINGAEAHKSIDVTYDYTVNVEYGDILLYDESFAKINGNKVSYREYERWHGSLEIIKTMDGFTDDWGGNDDGISINRLIEQMKK